MEQVIQNHGWEKDSWKELIHRLLNDQEEAPTFDTVYVWFLEKTREIDMKLLTKSMHVNCDCRQEHMQRHSTQHFSFLVQPTT